MGLTLEYGGATLAVPATEPPQNRERGLLFEPFRTVLEAFVAYANTRPIGVTLHIGECRRELARQVWLYAQGRVNSERTRSWTLDSRHRWGLAADLYATDENGTALWDMETWARIYELAPPELFGLKTIPQERVHVEAISADVVITNAVLFRAYQT